MTLNDQNLVDRVEYLTTNSVVGDVPVEITYSDYADFGGVKFPRRIVEKQDGFETLDVTIQRREAQRRGLARGARERRPGAGPAGVAERATWRRSETGCGRSTPPTPAVSPWSSRTTS